ncbi:MAG: hypothetical protein C5B59_07120 [Bacteroidetes bacterium]|nr:MAG: hypothetical protein C5B59_07120 [Bacteroidota bacterium]
MNLDTQIEVTTIGNLSDKTMFLVMEFNRFGNSRQADVEVANTTANQKRFKHSKKLLESPELDAIRKADMALRLWVDAQPTVWRYGKNMRIVGYEGVKTVLEACSSYKNVARPALVAKFRDMYLQRVAEAQATATGLGDQFNSQDFPSVQDIEKEFSFTYNLTSFSTPEQLKKYAPELFEMEQAKKAEQFSLAVEDWKAGRRAILQEMVGHLLDILKPEEGKKKKLHAATVTKLQDFLKTFDLDSVPDDVELQSEVAKLKLLMSGVDADKIKESDNLKAQLVEGFQAATSNLSNLVTTTGRKFR